MIIWWNLSLSLTLCTHHAFVVFVFFFFMPKLQIIKQRNANGMKCKTTEGKWKIEENSIFISLREVVFPFYVDFPFALQLLIFIFHWWDVYGDITVNWCRMIFISLCTRDVETLLAVSFLIWLHKLRDFFFISIWGTIFIWFFFFFSFLFLFIRPWRSESTWWCFCKW